MGEPAWWVFRAHNTPYPMAMDRNLMFNTLRIEAKMYVVSPM